MRPDADSQELMEVAFKPGINRSLSLGHQAGSVFPFVSNTIISSSNVKEEEIIEYDSSSNEEEDDSESESAPVKHDRNINAKALDAMYKASHLSKFQLWETGPLIDIPYERRKHTRRQNATEEDRRQRKKTAAEIEQRRRLAVATLKNTLASCFPLPSNMIEVKKAGTDISVTSAMIQFIRRIQEISQNYPELKELFPSHNEPTLADVYRQTAYHRRAKPQKHIVKLHRNLTPENANRIFGNIMQKSPQINRSLLIKTEL